MQRRAAEAAAPGGVEAAGDDRFARRYSKQWLMNQMEGVDLAQLAAIRLHQDSGAASATSSGATTPTRHAAQANDANNRFFKLLARFIRSEI